MTMNNLLKKIDELMTKPALNNSMSGQSGEQVALLRRGGIVYMLYYAAIALIIGLCNGFEYSAIAFLAAGLMLCVILTTYYTGSLYATLIGAGVVVVMTNILEVQTAGKFGMSLILMSVIPLIFCSIRLSTGVKIATGVVILIIHIIVDSMVDVGINPFQVVKNGFFVANELSQVVFAVLVMMVSYYFCKQYTQAEHQVYVINRQLKKMASLDPLTGLMNRRGMADVLPDMEEAYKAGTSGLSIAIGDIDFFKKVNDTYGHDCGDYVLKTVSAYFAKYMEDKGEICRWGGEEFLFAFNDKNADDVFVMLNDMRHTIKHMQFSFNDIDFKVTMTFGLEEYTPYAQLENTIKRADEKLYLGKESGRDKVVY